MITLTKNGIRWLKLLHLFTACCWLGGAVSLVTLNIHSAAAENDGMLHGIYAASHSIDMTVVVIFGAVGCLITGLLFSLLTPWGFFRHIWIAVKWLLTITAILTGTFFLGEWERELLTTSGNMGLAALTDSGYTHTKLLHLWGGLLQGAALFFMVGISVFKPWGLLRKKLHRA